jgi:single-stranded-DNA-specific exonuclease
VSIDKIWRLKSPSNLASRLTGEADVTPLQAKLLVNRGVSNGETARIFLHPQLNHMADPMLLKDMDAATEIIVDALENREKITVFGDYDADGLTATALLLNFLSSLGISVSSYIPNRLKEGYGLNSKAVDTIANGGTNLIITVDCGIANETEIAYAKTKGLKVVVTDHHQIPNGFRPDYPVVDPHRTDCAFPFKHLAGVGLAFFLAVAVRAALRKKGWFKRRPEPDLKRYLDLVALGTVADRVPLTGQNRILVNGGLGTMARSRWTGLNAMMAVANIAASEITAEDLAFKLGPRLNAPGRMGDPEIGVKALTIEEPELALDLALGMNAANSRRQSLEKTILDQIHLTIESREKIRDSRTLMFAGEDWHPGVLGIIASRLVDSFHRPSLVLNIRNGMAVGSGRSIEGFDLYHALGQLSHLFEKFGGHSHAAGFTLKVKNLDTLERDIEALARDTLTAEDLIPTIDVDAEILLEDITFETVRQIEALSPFGEGNPEPLFYARSLRVVNSRIVGGQHLSLKVQQGKKNFEAIGFGLSNHHSLEGKTVNMVFNPGLNRWQGHERLQLRIVDLEEIGQRSRLVLEDSGCELDVFGAENKE